MEKINKTPKLVTFFEKNTIPDPIAFNNMAKELEQFSEPLFFAVERSSDGWVVQCKQIPGIITGGSNPNPSDEEISNAIRDAIRAAFNIAVTPRPQTNNIDYFQLDTVRPAKASFVCA